ncbi:YebG family protein [uncultured Umboniibacter sp.]|uniref:YebG family protein n=1 Tax=uncultured Umboniibacter sp. TaxID=1798917 RepID=UPI002638996F|nr:YebG family protein [uncultured Umboniibacter sp.]
MAVIAMWKCDRDGKMFDDKKEAEKHDKMLELAAGFTDLFEAQAKSLNEKDAEKIGLLLAQHADIVISACKGKPEQLSEIS